MINETRIEHNFLSWNPQRENHQNFLINKLLQNCFTSTNLMEKTIPRFLQLQMKRMDPHPIFQQQLEGSCNSPICQPQLTGGYNPLAGHNLPLHHPTALIIKYRNQFFKSLLAARIADTSSSLFLWSLFCFGYED